MLQRKVFYPGHQIKSIEVAFLHGVRDPITLDKPNDRLIICDRHQAEIRYNNGESIMVIAEQFVVYTIQKREKPA